MLKYLITLILLFNCATHRKNKTEYTSLQSELSRKSEVYSELVNSHRDEHGFIMTEKCDALLFSGLLSASLPGTINILAARDDTGAWHRRPNHDCSPSIGNSRSTISRDMILGLFWHLYKNKDLDTAIELIEDLRSNAYKLRGQGTLGELLVNPSMLSTLAHIILKLDGPRYPIELAMPAVFGKHDGFVAHLTVWHILLRGELLGEIPDSHFTILQWQKDRQPNNPLFQAAYNKYLTGNQTDSILLLLDSAEWPADRLPTTNEHCSDWVIERDYSEKDWSACGPEKPFKEHTGAELIIIYNLIIKN